MYINYIQKYVDNSGITNNVNSGPLCKYLNKYLRILSNTIDHSTKEIGLVISPGYLSTTSKTAEELINEITDGVKISYCWILGTMNGNNKVNGSNLKVITINTNAFKKAANITLTQPTLIKSPKPFAKDHRKMIFVLVWEKAKNPSLNSLKDVNSFITKIDVPAITIGSSNFSKSTYFMGNDHNEADMLWIDEQLFYNLSKNIDDNIHPVNPETIFPQYGSSSNNDYSPDVVISKVISTPLNNTQNVSNYLKFILKNTLEAILI